MANRYHAELTRQSRHLFVRIHTAQPEPMGGGRADFNTGAYGAVGLGAYARGYTSFDIKIIPIQ